MNLITITIFKLKQIDVLFILPFCFFFTYTFTAQYVEDKKYTERAHVKKKKILCSRRHHL